ncbi:MAG: RluA family pseudouridine synthase [Candidatus Synoicihabitans palmerolidicus]|nr:RluA family pseudouridine synthase [Candidatus Synoicihabitans palmerolidicus]
MAQVYRPHRLRPAHRLDANTSGLVVCARTRRHAQQLHPQFDRTEVDKVYVARVQGRPTATSFDGEAPISDEPGPAGNRTCNPTAGKSLAARTEFRVLSYQESDDTTLIEARLITGRTHQIRLHLHFLGHPIVGDPIYGREPMRPGAPQTLAPDDLPLCLHCHALGFTHPVEGKCVTFTDTLPDWAMTAAETG